MTSPYLLIFMGFVTIVAASQQFNEHLIIEETNCTTEFARCERDLHTLRKLRERAKATSHKLRFQLWRLTLVEKELNNEVRILRHQVENPNEPVRPVEISSSGTGQINYLKDVDLVTTNCSFNLEFCSNSKNRERKIIQDFERESADQRSYITEQTRINDGLRVSVAALKSQLAARNMTPHPDSQLGDMNIPSSAEYELDSEEVERRVAATVDRVDQRNNLSELKEHH